MTIKKKNKVQTKYVCRACAENYGNGTLANSVEKVIKSIKLCSQSATRLGNTLCRERERERQSRGKETANDSIIATTLKLNI